SGFTVAWKPWNAASASHGARVARITTSFPRPAGIRFGGSDLHDRVLARPAGADLVVPRGSQAAAGLPVDAERPDPLAAARPDVENGGGAAARAPPAPPLPARIGLRLRGHRRRPPRGDAGREDVHLHGVREALGSQVQRGRRAD